MRIFPFSLGHIRSDRNKIGSGKFLKTEKMAKNFN